MCGHACFSEVENIVLLRLEPPLSTSPGVGGFPKPFFSCTFMELNARALSRSCLPLGASLHAQSGCPCALHSVFPGTPCSECIRSFPGNHPEIPSQLITIRKMWSRAARAFNREAAIQTPISDQTAVFTNQIIPLMNKGIFPFSSSSSPALGLQLFC